MEPSCKAIRVPINIRRYFYISNCNLEPVELYCIKKSAKSVSAIDSGELAAQEGPSQGCQFQTIGWKDFWLLGRKGGEWLLTWECGFSILDVGDRVAFCLYWDWEDLFNVLICLLPTFYNVSARWMWLFRAFGLLSALWVSIILALVDTNHSSAGLDYCLKLWNFLGGLQSDQTVIRWPRVQDSHVKVGFTFV